MADPAADRPYMPGYQIADAQHGRLLPWSWARERLERSHNYWVATTTPEGHPHLTAVWGVWLDDRFVFSMSPTSRKARNLRREPHCAVSTEEAGEAVIVEGIASIADNATVAAMLPRYNAKYDWDMDASQGPFWIVTPTRALGFIEAGGEFTQTATRWTFPGES